MALDTKTSKKIKQDIFNLLHNQSGIEPVDVLVILQDMWLGCIVSMIDTVIRPECRRMFTETIREKTLQSLDGIISKIQDKSQLN